MAARKNGIDIPGRTGGASGWRGTDLDEPHRHDEERVDVAWLVGLALLAVLAIATFVLIAAGLVLS